MPKPSRRFSALALACASSASIASTAATYVDLPIADARDHAFVNDVLYVTTDTRIHRYDLKSCEALPPIDVGTRLRGIDASQTGRFLAVADNALDAGSAHVFLIDLAEAGVPVPVSWPAAFGESGSFMVAWSANDYPTISGSYNGSGWVPLRRYDPNTGAMATLTSVRQNTMLAASGDGELIAVAESNSSAGPVSVWTPVPPLRLANADVNRFVFEIAADDYGTRVVVPTYYGAYVMARSGHGTALTSTGIIGQYANWGPLSVVVPPGGTQFISADWGWNSTNAGLKIYDAKTLALIKRVDAYPFPWNGNHALGQGRLTLSRDTRWLAATIAGGVRLYDLIDEPVDRFGELGEAPAAPSCGTLHAFKRAADSIDTRIFDADGWEFGDRPEPAPGDGFGEPVDPLE
jgi:hypothetical protein